VLTILSREGNSPKELGKKTSSPWQEERASHGGAAEIFRRVAPKEGGEISLFNSGEGGSGKKKTIIAKEKRKRSPDTPIPGEGGTETIGLIFKVKHAGEDDHLPAGKALFFKSVIFSSF